jgi:hypothetical protein
VSGQFAADRTPDVQDHLADGAPADAEPRREASSGMASTTIAMSALLVGGQAVSITRQMAAAAAVCPGR